MNLKICVAVGNKVMDTHLPLPVGSGDKYDVGSVQCGRSMIEMLGVLAIIAVLSVGGIAGYSKAMLNYKLNKSVEAHRDVIFGLIQYSDRLQPAEGKNLINEEIAALGLKPDNWRKNGIYLVDDVNNTIFIGIYGNDKHIGYEIRMPARAISHTADGRVVQSYPYHFCVAAIKQLILPLSEMIDEFSFYRTKSGWDSFYGSKECEQRRKCISQIKVSDIYKECQTCGTEDGEGCSIILKLQ